jgi:hypothetical protein
MPSAFWTSRLAEFQMQGIPVEIVTNGMLHPPKAKRSPWVKATYSDIFSNTNKQKAPHVIPGQSEHAQKSKSTADNVTAAMESNSSRRGQVIWDDSNMGNDTTAINSASQEESENEAHVPPRLEGDVSSLD